jgi:CRISPR-associated protein Csd1
MILKALSDYAVSNGLIEGMDSKERLVHLVLCIDHDGRLLDAAPWNLRTRQVPNPKKGTTKEEIGQPLLMPEFPGVNNGGKAQFLADSIDKVLGLSAKTGEPIPDDGKNPVKAFEHFWKRISDAFAETKNLELGALLKFRDLYVLTDDRKESLASIVGIEPFGKDAKPTFCARRHDGPIPLEGRTITFQVGAENPHLYADGSPLRDYWKSQFNRERFVESPADSPANLGACLVTGEIGVTIAEVHRTLIKGVPGLPPIGGYMVSFDEASPSFRSYGFEKGWNAPVSEDVAAAYALGLNHLLGSRDTARKISDSVLCSWVDVDRDAGVSIMNFLEMPTADSRKKFFAEFESGRFSHAFKPGRYRSLTLAANGGRVVVRRWLDEPLKEAVEAAGRWFDDLNLEIIEIPKKLEKPSKRKAAGGDSPAAPATETTHSPFSIYHLAATTARVPSEVQTTTYDLLYRAALDVHRFCPLSLLPAALQRLKIAAAERGNGVRFDTSRFALIKLILTRSGDSPMPVEKVLCETNDPPYNCGRLLAVLDDLQRAAQGQVGADIVSRFYGAASTYPDQVFPIILKLAQAHEKKLKKSANPKLQSKGYALMSRINDILSRFQADSDGAAPGFPSVLSPKEQGRFALGFHQQKAHDERAIKKYLADKAAGKGAEDPTLEALAETQTESLVTSD